MKRLDATFYPSPRLTMQAPAEGLAYLATRQVNDHPDALWVIDLDPHSTGGDSSSDSFCLA
jgi:methanethiol oxidase